MNPIEIHTPGLAQWLLALTALSGGFWWGWASRGNYEQNRKRREREQAWRASHLRWWGGQ